MQSTPLQLVHDIGAASVSVLNQGRLVWRYCYAGAPKPYVHPFATPAGEVLSLASPHDHIHHRGLTLAWRVNGVNFWEESPTKDGELNGDIVHDSWTRLVLENNEAVLVEQLTWIARDGVRHLTETRELRVSLDETLRAVRCVWSSVFSPCGGGDALISGYTVHCPISYYGLGFRFARALDHGGKHLDSEGRGGEAEANGKTARWHAYSGHLDETGTPVGVLIGDAPGNPRHPTSWFQISQPPAPFAYLTASLVAHEEFPLRAGTELSLRYAVCGREGAWSAEQGDAAWKSVFNA